MQLLLILVISVLIMIALSRVAARRAAATHRSFDDRRPPRMAQAEVIEDDPTVDAPMELRPEDPGSRANDRAADDSADPERTVQVATDEDTADRREDVDPPGSRNAADREAEQEKLYEIAHELLTLYQKLSHPAEFASHPAFASGMETLRAVVPTGDAVLDYFMGENMPIACLALETLARKEEPTPVDERRLRRRILDHVSEVHPWTRYFALRALDARTTEPVVADLLLALRPGWEEIPLALQSLDAFLERRGTKETVELAPRLDAVTADQVRFIAGILRRLDSKAAESLATQVTTAMDERVDRGMLSSIGRVREAAEDLVVAHDSLTKLVDRLQAEITRDAPRPQVLVGEPGVGKSTLLRALGTRLIDEGWTIFEAGASELVAGQRYLGDLENRIRELVDALAAPRRVVWIIPGLGGLLRAGTHEHSRVGALRLLMPYLLERRLRIVAEASPAGYERVLSQEPSVASIVDVHRLAALDPPATLDLARRWVEANIDQGGAHPCPSRSCRSRRVSPTSTSPIKLVREACSIS